MRKFFISFTVKEGGQNIFGSSVFELQGTIREFQDIDLITQIIIKKYNFSKNQQPVILYWREME